MRRPAMPGSPSTIPWQRDVASASASASGRAVADAARIRFERDGVLFAELRACQALGRDAMQLPGCAKVYLGDHRMIFQLTRDAEHRPILLFLAFGLGHPPPGRRLSVYRTAHRRLHDQ